MTRILSVFNLLKRVGFAVLLSGVSFLSHLYAAPITVNATNPTYFIANEGQWEGDFQFKCEVGSAVYYVTPQGMTVDFREFKRYPKPRDPRDPLDMMERREERDSVTVRGHVVQIHYTGANTGLTSSGDGKLAHYSNYFIGRDSTKWRSRVSHYEKIVIPEVWPGIDVEYRADKLGVETVYHVKPGAEPAQIQMEYIVLDAPLRIDAQGNLVLTTSLGEVKEKAPFAFQQLSRVRQHVKSRYRVEDDNRAGLDVEEFERGKELIVDPLLYGTYLGGGSTDYLYNICPAPDGGVYVAGTTYAMSGFPTTPGAYDETGIFPGTREFVSRFSVEGEFLASTLFGEIQTQGNPNTGGGANDLVFDSTRDAIWICGSAHPDWPLTPDALDTTIELGEIFMLRLSADLTALEYCSYLGGNSIDQAYQIALGASGEIYVAGGTYSTDFPVTPDALFTERRENDSFLWLFNPDLYEVVFSTLFGGGGVEFPIQTLHLGSSGHIWISGETYSLDLPVTANAFQGAHSDSSLAARDAYIALITLTPPTIEYCSYLGGDDHDYVTAIYELDSVIYISGQTRSVDFPVTPDAFDTSGHADNNEGFVARLAWETGDYVGTFISGEGSEFVFCNGQWVGNNRVILAGITTSADFPVTTDAYDSLLNQSGSGNELDGFVMKLTGDLSNLLYSSFIGGSGDDEYAAIWVENEDSLWLAGTTQSFDIPVTPDAFQHEDNPLNSGFVQHFAINTTEDTTSATEYRSFPSDFALTAFPNPFNPTTTLSFSLPSTSNVELIIHSIQGREVESVKLSNLLPGHHTLQVGNNNWASGVYIATLKTRTLIQSTKILLVR